jgi:hypothetical protein
VYYSEINVKKLENKMSKSFQSSRIGMRREENRKIRPQSQKVGGPIVLQPLQEYLQMYVSLFVANHHYQGNIIPRSIICSVVLWGKNNVYN